MSNRFKANTVYSGEVIFGGCGQLDTNKVSIIKRTKGWIVYKPEFMNKVLRARRDFVARFGDCFHTTNDDFYANSIEPTWEAF